MIEARLVLEAARDGRIPETWRVWHGRPAYFVGEGAFNFALGLIAAFVSVCATLVVVLPLLPSQSGFRPDVGMTIVFICVTIIIWILTGYVFARAVSNLRQIRSAKQQVLVLMPDGCVQGSIGSLEVTRTLRYAELADISLQVSSTKVGPIIELKISPRLGGAPSAWRLDGRFCPPDALAQRILGDFAAYRATHASADAR